MFLGLAPDDFRVAAAALNKAQEHRAEQQKALADYQSTRTASMTVQGITRWLSRALS